MSNRYSDWAIIYSPLEKESLNKDKLNHLINILKKNTTLYSISYETGDKGTNPHWDIVATFKSKQAKSDINSKFTIVLGPMIKPAVFITKVNDLQQRLGYNLKENLDFPFDHEMATTLNLNATLRETCIKHYDLWCQSQEQINKIRHTFKYINAKSALYEINKYAIESYPDDIIDTEPKLKLTLKAMLLDGFIFDIKATLKRKMVKTYLAYYTKDQTFIEEELDEWFIDETSDYRCHNCQSINQI